VLKAERVKREEALKVALKAEREKWEEALKAERVKHEDSAEGGTEGGGGRSGRKR